MVRRLEGYYQLSTINCQLSTVNCQLSTVNCLELEVNKRLQISGDELVDDS